MAKVSATVKTEKAPTVKIPKAIGAAADLYNELRSRRLAVDKEAAALKAQESMVRQHIIDNLPKDELTGAVGKTCRVTIVVDETVHVKDWDAFWGYVHKHKAYHLVQKRCSEAAVLELLNDKVKVPGVEKFGFKKLSLNQL